VNVTIVGTGAGFESCRRIVDVVMAKDALCEVEPCAFGGVYQPSLMETFGHGSIYAYVSSSFSFYVSLILYRAHDARRLFRLSYFYDRLIPLGLGVDNEPFKIADLRKLAEDVCLGPEAGGWDRFRGSKEAMDELEDRPEYCLDLSFMHSLLSLGYDLSDDREIRVGKKIDGVELGWSVEFYFPSPVRR
jgi:guanosine-diphosphatase